STRIRPIAPAISPARNEVNPSVAETVWASDDWKDSGNDPYLRTLASWRALEAVNGGSPPLIWVRPPGMASWIIGADTTCESSVKAVWVPMWAAVKYAQMFAAACLN